MLNLLLWGHTLADYQQMFDLTDADLDKKIIDCGAGPASFNAEMHQLGKHVVSVDELYNLPYDMLQQSINKQFKQMQAGIAEHVDKFNWDRYKNLAELTAARQRGLDAFFTDFELGRQKGRYYPEELNKLSFADASFDIALSAHYLFTIKAELGMDYHLSAIREMARVAKEVRIFPLLDGDGEITPLLGPILLALQEENYGVKIKEVPFTLHKNGNAMLHVWAQKCHLD